eukprot:scaffold21_cov368-Prasinococcus_capsulatus_cf.AAC.16
MDSPSASVSPPRSAGRFPGRRGLTPSQPCSDSKGPHLHTRPPAPTFHSVAAVRAPLRSLAPSRSALWGAIRRPGLHHGCGVADLLPAVAARVHVPQPLGSPGRAAFERPKHGRKSRETSWQWLWADHVREGDRQDRPIRGADAIVHLHRRLCGEPARQAPLGIPPLKATPRESLARAGGTSTWIAGGARFVALECRPTTEPAALGPHSVLWAAEVLAVRDPPERRSHGEASPPPAAP